MSLFTGRKITAEIRRLVIAAALLLILTLPAACALVPGGHIDYRVDELDLENLVDIEPITPALVSSLRNGLSVAQPMSPELRAELAAYEYRIGPGDVLSVIVYDHPELTIPAGGERSPAEAGNQVRGDGAIFYPYIGRVEVAGLTLEQVRTLLAERLAAVITEPQVDVGIAAFRSQKVYVSGAVKDPRALPVTNVPLTITDAISQVGGTESNANWHELILTRDGQEQRLSLYALLRQGDHTQNRLLRDGDVLHVPTAENQAVAVMGQVRVPGHIPLGNERISLTDAIALAGGVNEGTAQPSGVFVIRGQEETSAKLATVYQLDIRNATAFILGSQFTLQPQDVVYVTSAPLARWNRVITLLLPSAQLTGTGARAGTDLGDL